MVVLSIAMKQDEAIRIVESIDQSLKFTKKEGMSLYFETPNDTEYVVIIKKTLKNTSGFSALYFNVSVK